ncbi:MAG: site-specific integrase, partial [Pseudomonadota bacterium]|nr:site-specific integrase [Pseudomonadota bacterium]
MASFIKRNGRWNARVRKTGYPETTQTFTSEASALKWRQRVEYDPEKFLSHPLPEDHQLMTVGDL